MDYNVYRTKNTNEVVDYENNDNNCFVFALISFFLMLFFTFFAIVTASFGIYYGLKGKNRTYLIANIIVLITSILSLMIAYSQL